MSLPVQKRINYAIKLAPWTQQQRNVLKRRISSIGLTDLVQSGERMERAEEKTAKGSKAKGKDGG